MQGDIGADAGTGPAGHASATRNNCLSNLDQAFVICLNATLRCWVCSAKFQWTKMNEYKQKTNQGRTTKKQKDNTQVSEGVHPNFNEVFMN